MVNTLAYYHMATITAVKSFIVQAQAGESCCCMCHGRFHGILPKEYPGTFDELPQGLYKEMPNKTQGQSDILSHQTNI